MSEEDFSIERDVDHFDLVDEASERKSTGFPVRVQLLILALFLGSLFAGVIVPKSLALFNESSKTAALEAAAPEALVEETSRTIGAVKIVGVSAFVYDIKNDEILFEKKPDAVLPLASITKLMTALVAYELIDDGTKIEVSAEAANQQSGGPLAEGEVFEAKDLADFALISSYNSAAYTLADGVGSLLGTKDPVTQFVAAMNIKAKELGLDSLLYKNPTGLDLSISEAGAIGSARDTSLLMEYIFENNPSILAPTIRPYTAIMSESGTTLEAHNTNEILSDIPNLLGTKTGFTDLAGGNLTIVFDAGFNHPVVITVLGSTRNERFSDVAKLVKATKETIGNQSE